MLTVQEIVDAYLDIAVELSRLAMMAYGFNILVGLIIVGIGIYSRMAGRGGVSYTVSAIIAACLLMFMTVTGSSGFFLGEAGFAALANVNDLLVESCSGHGKDCQQILIGQSGNGYWVAIAIADLVVVLMVFALYSPAGR